MSWEWIVKKYVYVYIFFEYSGFKQSYCWNWLDIVEVISVCVDFWCLVAVFALVNVLPLVLRFTSVLQLLNMFHLHLSLANHLCNFFAIFLYEDQTCFMKNFHVCVHVWFGIRVVGKSKVTIWFSFELFTICIIFSILQNCDISVYFVVVFLVY